MVYSHVMVYYTITCEYTIYFQHNPMCLRSCDWLDPGWVFLFVERRELSGCAEQGGVDSTVGLASLLQGRVLSLHVAQDHGSCSFTSPLMGSGSSEGMGSDSIRGEARASPSGIPPHHFLLAEVIP